MFDINLGSFEALSGENKKRLGLLLRAMKPDQQKLNKNEVYFVDNNGKMERVKLSHSIKRRLSNKYPGQFRYQVIGDKIADGRRMKDPMSGVVLKTLIKSSPYYLILNDCGELIKKDTKRAIKSTKFLFHAGYKGAEDFMLRQEELFTAENLLSIIFYQHQTSTLQKREYSKPDGSSVKRTELYFFMPYFKGFDLFDVYEKGYLSTLEIWQKFRIIKNIFEELDKLHRLNILHLDLKPENILLDLETLNVKLIDLGNAKFISSLPYEKKPSIGGSALYASPEQFSNGKISERSDCYGLAAILVIILFDTNTIADYLQLIKQNKFEHLISPPFIHRNLASLNGIAEIGEVSKDDITQIVDFIKRLSAFDSAERPSPCNGFEFFKLLEEKHSSTSVEERSLSALQLMQ